MKTEAKSKRIYNVSLWIAQVVLAAMFLMAGIMKSTQPIEQLVPSLPWVKEVPASLVRFIGISELLGSIGLLLPSILRIKPKLTPLAALGIFTIMVFAFGFHFAKGQYGMLGINVILGAIAFFIAWGRYKKVPVHPKS